MLKDRMGFSDLRMVLNGSSSSERRIFASITDSGEDSPQSGCALGQHYRLEVLGVSGAGRMLSFLGASLGARMNVSRPPCFSHDLPAERPPSDLAAAASTRYFDSQAACATLCVLDTRPFLENAVTAFPPLNPECIEEDLARCLSAFFEASGGLFLCDSGELVALCCGSRPADSDLLRSQMGKYLKKFVGTSMDAPVRIRRSRTFESPNAAEMESFLADCSDGPAA